MNSHKSQQLNCTYFTLALIVSSLASTCLGNQEKLLPSIQLQSPALKLAIVGQAALVSSQSNKNVGDSQQLAHNRNDAALLSGLYPSQSSGYVYSKTDSYQSSGNIKQQADATQAISTSPESSSSMQQRMGSHVFQPITQVATPVINLPSIADLCVQLPVHSANQLKLCKLVHASPNANAAISLGTQKAISECRAQFKSERWNCSHSQGDQQLLTGHMAHSGKCLFACFAK